MCILGLAQYIHLMTEGTLNGQRNARPCQDRKTTQPKETETAIGGRQQVYERISDSCFCNFSIIEISDIVGSFLQNIANVLGGHSSGLSMVWHLYFGIIKQLYHLTWSKDPSIEISKMETKYAWIQS